MRAELGSDVAGVVALSVALGAAGSPDHQANIVTRGAADGMRSEVFTRFDFVKVRWALQKQN